MALEPHDLQSDAPAGVSRPLLLGGVAVACLLGVGLGLWARPAQSERRFAPPAAAAQPKAAAPVRSLEIVVDDRPAPVGEPLEVMSAMATAKPAPAEAAEPSFTPPVVLLAPRREPEGLVKVQAIAPPTEALAPAAPAPAPKPAPKAEAQAPASAPMPKARKPEPLKTKAAPAASKPKLVKAKAEQPKPAKAPASRLAKTEKTVKAKAKAAEVKLARTEQAAKPKLAKLVRVVSKAVPHRAKADAPRTVKTVAKTAPAPAAKLQKASMRKAASAKAPKADKPLKVAEVKTAPKPAPKPVAKPPRCAMADPGAALVCSNPTLGAVDRELARAYRQAQAAGVPEWRLEQQQQRWIAARANAAREAPWAVRDVYAARIAELRDMSRARRQEF